MFKVGRARRPCLPAVLRSALQAGRAVWGRTAHPRWTRGEPEGLPRVPRGSPYRLKAEIVASLCMA